MPFRDRGDAGRQLAASLSLYRNQKPIVFALPRGGVIVGAEIASALAAPLELVLVRKIGVPHHPELAMGAVVDGISPVVIRNADVIRSLRISDEKFRAIYEEEMTEIERRRALYLGSHRPRSAQGRTAIVVDDGIATGATVRAALEAIRLQHPRKTILAVPVAPSEAVEELHSVADEVLCLEAYALFGSVGTYYADFRQVSDHEVMEALKQSRLQMARLEGANG
jgi:predicted phosphoribosyltransferase